MLRYTSEYILLLAICASKVQKKQGGMAWVVCGVDGNSGERVVDNTYAEEMRALETGIALNIPDDSSPNGAKLHIVLQVIIHLLCTSWYTLSSSLLFLLLGLLIHT